MIKLVFQPITEIASWAGKAEAIVFGHLVVRSRSRPVKTVDGSAGIGIEVSPRTRKGTLACTAVLPARFGRFFKYLRNLAFLKNYTYKTHKRLTRTLGA